MRRRDFAHAPTALQTLTYAFTLSLPLFMHFTLTGNRAVVLGYCGTLLLQVFKVEADAVCCGVASAASSSQALVHVFVSVPAQMLIDSL